MSQHELLRELKAYLGDDVAYQGSHCPVIRINAMDYPKFASKIGKSDDCYHLKNEDFWEFPLCIRVDGHHGEIVQYYVLGEHCHRENAPAFMRYNSVVTNSITLVYYKHGKRWNGNGPTDISLNGVQRQEIHPFSDKALGADDCVWSYDMCDMNWDYEPDYSSAALPYGYRKCRKKAKFMHGYIQYKALPDGGLVEYGTKGIPGFFCDVATFDWGYDPQEKRYRFDSKYIPFFVKKAKFSKYGRHYDGERFVGHEARKMLSIHCNATEDYEFSDVCEKIMKESFPKWDLWRNAPLFKEKQDSLIFSSLFY